eukprot:TRINITY_DN14576_c1_g2_i1.p1 TRINITY_DN14576_c1_g2~~TRINITY_DN14576_c1_g2_i1.p1  ORF type:complete len:527 (+),score=53.95 TRINITY_DN14576_c1_g2_i1:81-1661(+)
MCRMPSTRFVALTSLTTFFVAFALNEDKCSIDSYPQESSSCLLQVKHKTVKSVLHDSVITHRDSSKGVSGNAGHAFKFELNAPSKEEINRYVVLAFILMGAAVKIGLAADWLRPQPENQSSYFVKATLAASYTFLIPGLVFSLFTFLVGIELAGQKFIISQVHHKPSSRTESMLGFIQLLVKTKGYLGAILVVLYAIVIPVVKLGLLVSAERMRNSTDPAEVKLARKRIKIVQFISKWACPDMFAYILLLYLFRALSDRSDILSTPCQLEVGFACFSIFCVFSTVGTMAITPPTSSREDEVTNLETPPAEPLLLRYIGTKYVAMVVGVLLVAFSVFLYYGVTEPAMGLRLHSKAFFKPEGALPLDLKPVFDMSGVVDDARSDVNLWKCIRVLLRDFLDHREANCFLAFIMLTVFMLLLAVLDMVVLLVASVQFQFGARKPPWTIKVTRWLKHCEMLDVAIMGVIVVCQAGAAYKKQGIVLVMMRGLLFLTVAEVLHYVAYYVVHGVFDSEAPVSKETKKAEESRKS